MRLKCIGGECDNQYYDIPDYLRGGDIFRIPVESILESSTIKCYNYQLSKLHFSKDRFMQFLIPQTWTNEEAVRYQFRKNNL